MKTLWDSVGNTPLLRINSLSEITGCEILAKAEYLNPCGSIKDRAAKGLIDQAEKEGRLKPGGTIIEGTAGNTGIALASLGRERGYKVILTMPDNQSAEKYEALKELGVDVRLGPSCPFSHEDHFYHRVKKLSLQIPGAFFSDQFENLSNSKIHYETTGPEIWEQSKGKVDILVSATGTGGTLGGTSRYLKERNKKIKIVAVDPMGSVIFNYLKNGRVEFEGASIAEGVGITRLTENFKTAIVDDCIQVKDQDLVNMAHHLVEHDGLVVGMSSALNLYGAFQLAKIKLNKSKTIITFLCDHGSRYKSRIFNSHWLEQNNLKVYDDALIAFSK